MTTTTAHATSAATAVPADVVRNPRLGQWLSVTSEGRIGVRVGKVELGQGILTALAQVAADALGVPSRLLQMVPATTGTGPDEGLTAGSMSTMHAGGALRHVGAVARAEVLRLAATQAGADPSRVGLDASGAVTVEGAATRLDYAELLREVDPELDLTSAQPATDRAPVEVGTSLPRLDLPAKVLGRPAYVGDLRPDGLHYGRVLRPPSVGARLRELDDDAVAAVRDDLGAVVVRDGSFVGAVAARERDADRALDRLRSAATWSEQELLPDEDALADFLRAGPHEDEVVADDAAPGPGGSTLRASYSKPFLAHGSIAPSCALARWSGGQVQVWSHSQGIHQLRDALATVVGLPPERVWVQHAENAGCYGHNGADDAALDAVLLARAAPEVPVQVRWSRQDELTWAPLSSGMCVDLSATVSQGRLTGWRHDVWSQGHSTRPGYAGVPGLLAAAHLAEPFDQPAATDPPAQAGGGSTRNADPIYRVGARRVVGHRLARSPLRSSAMRSLGAFTNVFAIESFVDEVAHSLDRDPVEFRLDHLDDPRAAEVLRAVANRAGWGAPVAEGVGRGVGLARYKGVGAYCAVVAEVETGSAIVVRRLTVAVDVGLVVSPDGVRNQIEGGATQATSWTTKERVRFDRRRITSEDWESYPILTFAEAPVVDVVVIDRPREPSVGAGEAAQGPTAAAIANAVHNALGVRVRDLPLTAEAVVAAIERDD